MTTKTTTASRATRLAERTEDAFSASRYASWTACAQLLLARGYSEREAEAILRSKWMRWAADKSDRKEPTAKDVARFLDNRGRNADFPTDAHLAREVARLVKQTFED